MYTNIHVQNNNTEEIINEFKGVYRWLSNFEAVEIRHIGGLTYPSVEHAYQANKSQDIEWWNTCATTPSPGQIKRLSRAVKLVENWEEIKEDIMFDLLLQKFTHQKFKDLLLATENVEIIEGNYWGDVFWGVDLKTGLGENKLGHLLMSIRRYLKRFYRPLQFYDSFNGYVYLGHKIFQEKASEMEKFPGPALTGDDIDSWVSSMQRKMGDLLSCTGTGMITTDSKHPTIINLTMGLDDDDE